MDDNNFEIVDSFDRWKGAYFSPDVEVELRLQYGRNLNVVQYGQMTTLDYDLSRVRVYLAESGHILEVRRG